MSAKIYIMANYTDTGEIIEEDDHATIYDILDSFFFNDPNETEIFLTYLEDNKIEIKFKDNND